jgi:hypothetical protein
MKSLLLSLLLFTGIAFAQEAVAPVEPAFPLSVSADGKLDAGTLYSMDVKYFPFKITNTSDKDVTFNGLRMNCNCMTVAKETRGAVIKPGESIEAAVNIDPNKLKYGTRKLDRFFWIDAEGYDKALRVPVFGVIKPSVKFEPAEVIDVQQFGGLDIPWSRTFTITNANPEVKNEDFILEAPAGTRFNTEFKLVEPGKYQLTVSPKLPLKAEKVFEIFPMQIKGRGDEAVVRVGITGEPKGYQLRAQDRAFPLRNTLRDGKDVVMEIPLRFALPNGKDKKKKKRNWTMPTVTQPALADEFAYIDKDPAAYMLTLKNNITFNAPDNAIPEIVAGDNTLTLKITFKPDFAKQATPTPIEMVYCERTIGSVETGLSIREPKTKQDAPKPRPFWPNKPATETEKK